MKNNILQICLICTCTVNCINFTGSLGELSNFHLNCTDNDDAAEIKAESVLTDYQ